MALIFWQFKGQVENRQKIKTVTSKNTENVNIIKQLDLTLREHSSQQQWNTNPFQVPVKHSLYFGP